MAKSSSLRFKTLLLLAFSFALSFSLPANADIPVYYWSGSWPLGNVPVGQTLITLKGFGGAGPPLSISVTAYFDSTSNPAFSISSVGCVAGSCTGLVSFSPTTPGYQCGTLQSHTLIEPDPASSYLGVSEFDTTYFCGNGTALAPTPTPTPTPTPKPSVMVDVIHVTQAAEDFKLNGSPADLDLVLGKSTVVQVALSTSDGSTQSGITVNAKLSDGSMGISKSRLIVGPGHLQVDLLPLVPTNEGAFDLTISASGSNIQSGSVVRNVWIKKTKPINLTYAAMSCADCAVHQTSADSFQAHITESNLLIEGMYPIAKNSIQNQSWASLPGSSNAALPNPKLKSSMIERDLAKLETLSHKYSSSFIGVMPSDYFDKNNYDGVKGLVNHIPSKSAVFRPQGAVVVSGWWVVTAHELAHTFGIEHGDASVQDIISYWVDKITAIKSPDLMSVTKIEYEKSEKATWISSSEYQVIFKKLLLNPTDPQTMLVSGFIGKDGEISLEPMVYLPNGVASEFNSSDSGVVALIGPGGSALAQASFTPSFSLYADNGNAYPTDSGFFIVQVPAARSSVSVEISYNGKKVASFNPSSMLLTDTIKQIADSSFRFSQKQIREAMLIQATNIGKEIKTCSGPSVNSREKAFCLNRAEDRILTLREQISRELNDSIPIDPSLISRSEALRNIDEVVLQLIPDLNLDATRNHVNIHILRQHESCQTQNLFTVKSVTQGTHGAVAIDKDGSITYSPDSNQRKADSFTVTIQSIEGDTITKTIGIRAFAGEANHEN